jgi:hypothetical protein
VCACATGSCTSPVVTEGHVTPSEVVSLGCSLRRPRPIFSMVTGIGGSLPEVTSVTWPEVTSVAGIECMFCACSVFSRFFPNSSTVVTWLLDVTEGHLTPSRFPWVCACATRSCATPVVTEGHVTPLEVSLGRSLRRPRPIFSMVTGTSHPRPIFSMVTGTSPGYLPLLFSYSVYIGCVVLQVFLLC